MTWLLVTGIHQKCLSVVLMHTEAERAGCETAVSCISKNRFNKTTTAKQSSFSVSGHTVAGGKYEVWFNGKKAILSAHCYMYSTLLMPIWWPKLMCQISTNTVQICFVLWLPYHIFLPLLPSVPGVLKINSSCWRQNINLYFSKLTILGMYHWSCRLYCCSALVMLSLLYTEMCCCSWPVVVVVVRGYACFYAVVCSHTA